MKTATNVLLFLLLLLSSQTFSQVNIGDDSHKFLQERKNSKLNSNGHVLGTSKSDNVQDKEFRTKMSMQINCFKAYDIRGRIPDQLNSDVAYRVGNAMAEFLEAKRIVLARDIRLSSAELADAVTEGLTDAGVEVLDIGLGGTEMVYFATGHLELSDGIFQPLRRYLQ